MTIRHRRWRVVARVLILALAIAAVPLPSLAQEKSPPGAQPGIQASIQKAVTQTPVKIQAARTQGTTAPPKKSFFKSPAGLAVLAIVGVGVAYAAVAANGNDHLSKEPWVWNPGTVPPK